MIRADIVEIIGKKYLRSNIENDEFSYPKEYKKKGIKFIPIKRSENEKYKNLDIRFVSDKDKVAILVETKQNFKKDKKAKEQLSAYVNYEKKMTGYKIIAILANTTNEKIVVWKNDISDENLLDDEIELKSFDDYKEIFTTKINDKEKIMQNTYSLNNLLNKYGIDEDKRSQFVGSCLLALKNDFSYEEPNMSSEQICGGIVSVITNLLNKNNTSETKKSKLVLLKNNILEDQNIQKLSADKLRIILKRIKETILPYINDKSDAGQDLLNLFFVTFNKYAKNDKNQAFTPDHITHFMAKVCNVNKNSVVLDPCCGSGAFLVRAMAQATSNCSYKEKENIMGHQIFGIESDENVFGLAVTNMLIHSDGNSNIINGSCFDSEKWIINAKPNIVLMNPPYNAKQNNLPEEYVDTWNKDTKQDPSKGFYYVKYILDILNKAKLKAKVAALLPVSCAIGSKGIINDYKVEVLKNNHLDAVFTLPPEVFYPGASASVCCMVFETCTPHSSTVNNTFFGYYKNDGFKKKKYLGRIEQTDPKTKKSLWGNIEKRWLELYQKRKSVDGYSAVHKVTGEDEWLCEAYMKTDYSNLSQKDFEQTIRSFLAYKIESGDN